MSKVFVKLRDRGTAFHDRTQDYTVTGDKVHTVELTTKIEKAIRNGVLIQVPAPAEAVAPKVEETVATPVAPAEPTKEAEPADETGEVKEPRKSTKK